MAAKFWGLVAAAVLSAQAGAAGAETLKVFSTIALRSALEQLAPGFETANGVHLDITWGTAALLAKRVEAGETADVLILSAPALDALAKTGKVALPAQAPVASSDISAVVKHGAPKLDLSTPEAFKAAMLATPSVAYSDPASGGSSGVHVAKLFERFGIADAMKPKTRHPPPSGNSAKLTAAGDAAIAIQQTSEVLTVPGIDLVGPLPASLNTIAVFSAGTGTASAAPGMAQKLIDFLHTPEAGAVFKAKGLEPD